MAGRALYRHQYRDVDQVSAEMRSAVNILREEIQVCMDTL
jgi:hypothetical protein